METVDTLRIYHYKDVGNRKCMEDEIAVISGGCDQIPTTYLGVFDGHGGKEAAIYARDHLFSNLKEQPGFFDTDPQKVKEAIRQGFLKTHNDMFKIFDTWPKRKDGYNSTSGTTATIIILRKSVIFVAHVGDSAAVIAQKTNNRYVAEELTTAHKPESKLEKSRIEQLGGCVANSKGVRRVSWKRAVKHNLTNTPRYDYIPFLAMSRALGDFWSYDTSTKQFIVSPDPDIHHIDLDESKKNKFIILASDGLWDVINAKKAVNHVINYEINHYSKRRNCCKALVNLSLRIWQLRCLHADNISAIVVFLDDEFKNWSDDEDSESIGSSEADTVIITNGEDDTLLMSTNENLSSLVCPIALPFTPTSRLTASDSSDLLSCDDARSGIDGVKETATTTKRKNCDWTNHKSKLKKAKKSIAPP